jgi:CBS domain-containing protein
MSEITATGTMPIGAIVGDGVVTIDAGADLHEIASALTGGGIGALAIGAGPDGIVTEHDLVVALSERRSPTDTRAADIATTELIWCDVDATVAEVAELMMERYVRHVLVEDAGELVGIVSARDLLGIYASGDMEIEEG